MLFFNAYASGGTNYHCYQSPDPRVLQAAIKEQDVIGWENFLFGRFSIKLRNHQQWHLDRIGSSKKATSWASSLINETWDLVFQMWDHRNKINKGTLTAQDKKELKSLQHQVKKQFQKGRKGLNQTDHHLLSDKHDVLSLELPDLREWVSEE